MGKIGEEITQKIKSAVKAKLIELGIEVDNELPDYIMVLVANKKTQPQMEKDLQLFLGHNTVLFTTWLINVLKKLEEVTVSKKNYKKIEVTNQEGNVIVKKEEDVERGQAAKKPVRIKVEPGTANSEPNEDCLIISAAKDPQIEGSGRSGKASTDEESNSSDEDSDSKSKPDESVEHDKIQGSSDQNVENQNLTNDEHASQEKSPDVHSDRNAKSQEHEKSSPDRSSDDSDSENSKTNTSNKGNSIESNRPKIKYGSNDQIDEVMEKTINGNKHDREEDGRNIDDKDDKRPSSSDRRLRDNRSSENDSISRRRLSDDRPRKPSRSPVETDRRKRSPEDYDRWKRSPDDSDRRKRTPDDSDRQKRSPDDSDRRKKSPVDYDRWRRSPDTRKRGADDYRRSPPPRRRVPGRSPENRRRSPPFRRRSPYDRRRSPDSRRRSPEDRRRFHDDRGRRDDKSPERSRLKIVDAREILKRRNNRGQDDSHLDHKSSYEDSHRSEKRRKVVSSLVHKAEDQRERSVEPQIPSLVRVTPRPLRKESIQPNKKLLLLAVADAEKSVSRPHNKRLERYSPPPGPVHSSSRKRELPKRAGRRSMESHSSGGYVPPEKLYVTLTNNKKYSSKKSSDKYEVSREISARKSQDISDFNLDEELLYEESFFDYDQDDMEADEVYAAEHDEYFPLPVKDKFSSNKTNSASSDSKCIISLESSPERSCEEWEEMTEHKKKKKQQPRSSSMEDEEGLLKETDKPEECFEWSRLGPALVATVKPQRNMKYKGEAVNKALERCKFWPACLSENCIYYHPSAPCKLFPQCKSGKECLFIHPDCKFGGGCMKPKCNFLHRPLNEKFDAVDIIPSLVLSPPVVKSSPPVIKCIFFPNCKNLSCKFYHPIKSCKYGRTCTRSDCYFSHPSLVIPPKELLTWTSKI